MPSLVDQKLQFIVLFGTFIDTLGLAILFALAVIEPLTESAQDDRFGSFL